MNEYHVELDVRVPEGVTRADVAAALAQAIESLGGFVFAQVRFGNTEEAESGQDPA